MKKAIQFLILMVTVGCFSQEIVKKQMLLMGCNFDVTVVAKNTVEGEDYIKIAVKEIKRIENVISSWDAKSETSKINQNAGIQPVKVSKELLEFIERAVFISKLTDGAFDVTYASMDRIWKFNQPMESKPSEKDIKASVAKVGFRNIQIDKGNQTVYLPQKGMKIGFGAIGKGYAADKAKKLLQKIGVKGGIINASGDMNTWGTRPNGKEWTVVITNPFNKKNAFAILPVSNKAVVTSGDYEKYVQIEGERYAHIIDPRTGHPVRGISSVTVFSDSAELADALATSVFVMGIKTGLDRINQLPNIECLIIDDKGSVHTSKNLKIDTWKK